MNLVDILKKEEGFRGEVYKCSEGFDTIGYGSKLPIDEFEAELLLAHSLGKFQREIQSELMHLEIEDDAWDVLYLMAYQLGTRGVMKFKNMIVALEAQDYEEAALQMLDSRWARQTPERAKRMADMMREV